MVNEGIKIKIPRLATEDLFELGSILQRQGFAIDTRHYIQAHQVQDILVALKVDGEVITTERMKSILSPIFCSTPDEQTAFDGLFDAWLKRKPQLLAQFEPEPPPDKAQIAEAIQQKQLVQKSKQFRYGFWPVIGLTGLLLASFLIWRFFIPEKPPELPKILVGQVLDDSSHLPVPGAWAIWQNDTLATDSAGYFNYGEIKIDTIRQLEIGHPGYITRTIQILPQTAGDTLFIPLHKEQPLEIFKYNKIKPEILPFNIDSLNLMVNRINRFAERIRDSKLNTWQRFYLEFFPLILIGATALPFLFYAIWLLIRFLRRRLILERLTTSQERKSESVYVQGNVDYLYRNNTFRRLVQRYRLHREEPTLDLNVPATIDATIQNGGLFSPQLAFQNVLPEYLILIDRSSFNDQHAGMLESLIRRMKTDGLIIDRYYFHGDPRVCQTEKPEDPQLTIQELLSRYPRHRLLIFSDGARFLNIRTRQPQPWLEQFLAWPHSAIFVPDKSEGVEYLEMSLKNMGFQVGPANLEGLTRNIEIIQSGPEPRSIIWERISRFPDLLTAGKDIWFDREPPPPEQLELLMQQLKNYLAPESLYWLAACAIYPELHWELTLYLATRLKTPENAFPSDTEQLDLQKQLLDLTRLPWFRHGTMPDWLRLRLITDLTPQQHQTVRQELNHLLETAEKERNEGLRIDYIRRTPLDSLRDLRNRFLEKVHLDETDNPLHDYIFSNYMSCHKPGLLAVLIPEKVRKYFFHSGQIMLGVKPVITFLIAFFMSLMSFTMVSGFKPVPQTGVIIPTFNLLEKSQLQPNELPVASSDSTVAWYLTQSSLIKNNSDTSQLQPHFILPYKVWLMDTLKKAIQLDFSRYAIRTWNPKQVNTTQLPLERAHFYLTVNQGLSQDEVRKMLEQFNYSSQFWYTAGTGFPNNFQISPDSLVIYDQASGLLWQRGGSENYMTYHSAEAYIDSLNRIRFAGYQDWRLPTVEEAMSLVESTRLRGGSFIDPIFDNTQWWIWTADRVSGGSFRWVVNFSNGNRNINNNRNVRLVRSGHSSTGE